MAADILLYDAAIVPVGKDQAQHIEMTRDVASRFHAKTGTEVFVLPEAQHNKETMYVPGTDGAKMSKSKGNIIDIFLPDKKLRKQIMGIQTDSMALEDPKNPDTCNVFALYKLLASPEAIESMRTNYEKGGYGYGHAKQALYECICNQYTQERERYTHYMNNPNEIDAALQKGAEKAEKVANNVLKRVRNQLGY